MDQPSQAETRQEDLPPSLQRALSEPDEYAVRLRTGEVVRFAHAKRHGAFVTLLATRSAEFPYGLEVRISEIAWCARGLGQLAPESPTMGTPQFADTAQSSSGVRVPVRIQHADT
jgi:hypothetical protein